MSPRQWLRRALLALPLVAMLGMAGATGASAHSAFVQSDPADGAILAKAPVRVVLLFSSPVSADFTSVEMVEAHGQRYRATSVVADRATPTVVVVGLPEIPTGAYRLTFSTRDSIDLHQTSGTIVFGVGVAPPVAGSPPQAAPARPSEVLLRWAGLAGLAAVLGALVVALLVVPRLPRAEPRGRIQAALFTLGLVGVGLQVASGTALLAVQATGLEIGVAAGLAGIAGSEYGSRWLVGALISAALAPFLLLLRRQARRGEVPGLVEQFRLFGPIGLLSGQARIFMLAIGQAAALAISGHAVGAGGPTAGDVILRAAHLTALGVWTGGLLALAIALAVLGRSAGARTLLSLLLGFGPYAAGAVATLGVSGLLLAGTQVATVTALLSTSYGAVLVGKVGLFAVVALIALRHALPTWRGLVLRRLPARAPRGLRLTIAIEGAGAFAIVLLGAVLSSSAPARGPQFDRSPPATTTLLTRQSGELLTAVSIRPNRQGPNLVSVQVLDTRRPPLAAVEAVTVVLQRPGSAAGDPLPTTRTGSRFDAGRVDLVTGDLTIEARVQRPGQATTVVRLPWEVNGPEVRRAPVVVSAAPLAPLTNVLAASLAALATILLLVAALINRRRQAAAAPAIPAAHTAPQRGPGPGVSRQPALAAAGPGSEASEPP